MTEVATSQRTLRLPGGALHVAEGGEGPPVVLLHGLGAGPDLWRDLVPGLTGRMRVVVPDLRDQPASDPRATAELLGRMLAELAVEELAVVGHGFGGVVAEWLALRAEVRCLVLIDAGAADPPSTGSGGMGEGPDRDALRTLDIPALILWGEEDPFLSVELADALADALPMSTLVLLPGCGHFLPRDAAETVATLVGEFLRFRYLGLSHEHDHTRPTGPVPVDLRRGHGPA